MRLTPSERDRLLVFTAAELARARRARGLLLNLPEATALIADTVCEVARDGGRLGDALAAGRAVLGDQDVLPGVAELLTRVDVEAGFDDGTRLVVITHPIRPAPSGSPSEPAGSGVDPLADRTVVTVTVRNTSEVPISVASHFHFFEANPRLIFDREAAYGHRAALPAGEVVRIAAGGQAQVRLTPIRGERVVIGFAGLVDGPLDAPGAREAAFRSAQESGYLSTTWASP